MKLSIKANNPDDLRFGIWDCGLKLFYKSQFFNKIMKIYTVILTVLAAFAVIACSKTEPANQPPNTANTAVQPNQAIVETQPAQPALSPSDTLKALNEASKKKDTGAIKSYLSNGTLALLEESAAKQKQQVDDLLKEDGSAPFYELPKILGEKVEGETATVEVENAMTKAAEKIPFVKENGVWKVAIDVYLKNLEAEIEKESETSDSNK